MSKIAYLSYAPLSDLDLSYLQSAQLSLDIEYFLFVSPHFQHGAAVDIKTIYKRTGIFSADIYPELSKFRKVINMNKVHVINTYGKLWFLKAVFLYFEFLFYLLRNKFQILHLTIPLNIYEWPLYFLKNKTILTVHDPIPHSGEVSFLSMIRRRVAFEILNNFIVLNDKQITDFIELYKLQKKRVFKSGLSVYSYLNSMDCEYIHHFTKPYALFFGRISPYKGLEYLFEAFNIVEQKGLNIDLVVAGSGKFYFDTNSYKENNFILLNRFIPESELITLLKGAYLVVCPYTDATQSGVIMTSFAFNKPVIVTDVGDLPNMVGYGKYGIIVPPSDSIALASAIEDCILNPEMMNRFSKNISYSYLTGDKSWNFIVENMKTIYNSI